MGVILERWERGWQGIDHVQTPWALTGVSIDIKRDAAGETHPPNSPVGEQSPDSYPDVWSWGSDHPSELTSPISPGWGFPGVEGLARLGQLRTEGLQGGTFPAVLMSWTGSTTTDSACQREECTELWVFQLPGIMKSLQAFPMAPTKRGSLLSGITEISLFSMSTWLLWPESYGWSWKNSEC